MVLGLVLGQSVHSALRICGLLAVCLIGSSTVVVPVVVVSAVSRVVVVVIIIVVPSVSAIVVVALVLYCWLLRFCWFGFHDCCWELVGWLFLGGCGGLVPWGALGGGLFTDWDTAAFC